MIMKWNDNDHDGDKKIIIIAQDTAIDNHPSHEITNARL